MKTLNLNIFPYLIKLHHPCALFLFLFCFSHCVAAAPVRTLSARELFEASDNILFARVLSVDIEKRDEKIWIVYNLADVTNFKGKIEQAKLWIEPFSEDLNAVVGKHKDLPEAMQNTLLFLRHLKSDKFSFAVDPTTQGRFTIPPNVAKQPVQSVEDLLSAFGRNLLKSTNRNDCYVATFLFPLLSELDHEATREMYSQLGSIQPEIAAVFVETQIQAGDLDIIPAASRLVSDGRLPKEQSEKIAYMLQHINDYANQAKRVQR